MNCNPYTARANNLAFFRLSYQLGGEGGQASFWYNLFHLIVDPILEGLTSPGMLTDSYRSGFPLLTWKKNLDVCAYC